MEHRAAPCWTAALAVGAWKGAAAWAWLKTPVAAVALKDVLWHGASAGDYLVASARHGAALLHPVFQFLLVLPVAVAWGTAAAGLLWCLLAARDALPPKIARAVAAALLVCAVAVSARAGLQAVSVGLSGARLAAAVAMSTRGRVHEFARPNSARALSDAELSEVKRALLRRPLLSPEKPRGPFDRMLKLEGGAWSVTAAYDSRLGVERALLRAD